jgi:hypothetical protein
MRSFYSFLIFTLLMAGPVLRVSAQAGGLLIDTAGTVHPWNHLQIDNDSGIFQFAVVADRTGGQRPGVFREAITKLNLLHPDFVISVGDLIEGYTTDREKIYHEWKEISSLIDSLQMPFFYIPGNHDFTDKTTADIWNELFGRRYYHFVYRDVLFLCLNTEESLHGTESAGIGRPQYEYISKVLADYPDVRWTMVFMHRPLWLSADTLYWKDVELLLSERRHTVFSGHKHSYIRYERNNGIYYVLATTGGISQLRGTSYGEFDHVVWITMTDRGPVIANLLLQGILEENIVTEDMQELLTYQPVKIEPLFTPDGQFHKDDTINIRIENNKNLPMWAALKFDMHPIVVPEIIELQKLIEPNSVEVVDIPMIITGPVNISNAKPLILYGKFLFRPDNGRDIELSSVYGLLPVKPEYCSFAEKAVQVDGSLSEWIGFPFKGNSRSVITGNRDGYTGDFDGSYEFAVSYDDAYIYVGLSVWDDEVITDSDRSTKNCDMVRLFLDARPATESSNNHGQDNYTEYLFLDFSLTSSGKDEPVLHQKEGIPEKLRISCRETVPGAEVEIAVPIEYLKEMNDTEWKKFRLNMAYLDYDENSPLTTIWWKPDWGSKENYIGSGMFFMDISEIDR